MKEKMLLTKASELFRQFNNEEISIEVFKHRLIALTYEIVEAGIWDKEHVENHFIPEYIEKQFNDYKAGSHYLLSRNSSGSLLQQFVMGLEEYR